MTADYRTDSMPAHHAVSQDRPATRAEIAQLEENIREIRKLHISTMVLLAVTLVAAIAAAVTASYSALVIYRVVEGLRQAFPS
jgi:hypothetical protein